MGGEKMKGFFNSLTPKQQEAALGYDGPENFGFPMTSENAAPADMPGVEEIARVLAEAQRQKPIPDGVWRGMVESFHHLEGQFPDYANGYSVSTDAFRLARAAQALFAPILAEKERLSERVRELALMLDKQMGTPCEQIRHQHMYAALTTVAEKRQDEADQQAARADAAEARALAAEAAVLAVAPHVDSIVCYASTIDEHDGNRIAKLVNEAAAAIRAQGE